MADKLELYKRIKIAGILSFIPFILAGGVAAGYFAAEFLENKFLLPHLAMPVCMGLGLLASVIEVVRVIKLAVRIERKT